MHTLIFVTRQNYAVSLKKPTLYTYTKSTANVRNAKVRNKITTRRAPEVQFCVYINLLFFVSLLYPTQSVYGWVNFPIHLNIIKICL